LKTLPVRAKCSQIIKAAILLGVVSSTAWASAQGVNVTLKIHLVDIGESGKKVSGPGSGQSATEVVAWLTPLGASAPVSRRTPPQTYRLVQKNKQFTPHLLVIPTGSSIDFPNLDPFFHNVFSLFNGKRFDLGLYEAGSQRSVRFDRTGVSYIFCNIHPEMGAVVIALNTPYYATSTGDGRATLNHVPPGDYELKLWSEGVSAGDLAAATRTVKVANADVEIAGIDLSRANGVVEHKNKFGEDYKAPADRSY
jgi:plastocyanin